MGRRRSAAEPANAAVHMEVVVVLGVVIGPKHDPEVAAGAVVGGPEKPRLGSIAAPLPAHADVAPVGQREAADVDGVGDGMLAAPALPELGADDVAARVGAVALHRGHALMQDRL